MDRFVEVAGRKIHIYSYGEAPITIVLLSGSGVPFPQLEYKSFQKELADAYRVIGIEKPGYGHSDLTEADQTIDLVIYEYRCALRKFGVTTPVVLAAHSMGFIEAIRWGQQYPSEILGFLGIDPAAPECYREFDLKSATDGLVSMSGNEQLRRTSAHDYTEQLIEDHLILDSEKAEYEALAYRNLANQNWISEAKNLMNALKLINNDNPYLQIPMLFFISNGEGTTLKKDTWFNCMMQYLNKIEISQYQVFDYPHNLYKFAYQEMAEVSKEFIAKYINQISLLSIIR